MIAYQHGQSLGAVGLSMIATLVVCLGPFGTIMWLSRDRKAKVRR